jgi:hypothetical protein
MFLRELGLEGVAYIHLAQNKEQWRAFVYTVLTLRVRKRPGIY